MGTASWWRRSPSPTPAAERGWAILRRASLTTSLCDPAGMDVAQFRGELNEQGLTDAQSRIVDRLMAAT